MREENGFTRWFFWTADQSYRLSESQACNRAAALCGVSLRTAQHWRRLGQAPEWALRHLVYGATGLPAGPAGVSENWAGWRFVPELVHGPSRGRGRRRGEAVEWRLCSPNGGRGWAPVELDFVGMQLSRLRDLERELQRLSGPAQFLLPLA